MHLVLNEDEQMVRTSCADFLAEQAGPDLLRQLRDSDDPTGYSGELWDKMIELGWAGVLIDESLVVSVLAMLVWDRSVSMPGVRWRVRLCFQPRLSAHLWLPWRAVKTTKRACCLPLQEEN